MKTLLVLLIFAPVISLAMTKAELKSSASPKDYLAEGVLAVYTLDGHNSTLLGGSVSKEFFKDTVFGLRALIPFFGDQKSNNVFSFQTYSRVYFKKSSAEYFAELNLGLNGITGTKMMNYFAAGTSVGVSYRVAKKIRVGGLVGGELATKYINNGSNFYPKIAILSTLNF